MLRALLVGAAALALLSPGAALAQSARGEDEVAIQGVVDAFLKSIVDKDRARFLALFLDQRTMWQAVNGDALVAGGQVKAPIEPQNSPVSFIDGIVSSPDRLEERFENLRIDTDGDVASVDFDFTFHVNGQTINRGRESWHLVDTGAGGWKIVSVIYSNND